MTATIPGLPSEAEQRKYAERLISGLDAIERERNLCVYELDARMIARWILMYLDPDMILRSHEPPRTSDDEPPARPDDSSVR